MGAGNGTIADEMDEILDQLGVALQALERHSQPDAQQAVRTAAFGLGGLVRQIRESDPQYEVLLRRLDRIEHIVELLAKQMIPGYQTADELAEEQARRVDPRSLDGIDTVSEPQL